MSDLSLIDIVNLIRAEIARTEIGDVKRITGPAGPQGPQGEAGIQGPQGPRGNDGKQGPAGVKGDQGKKGDKGVKGDDGADGVGIARVEQDIDNNIVIYTTDGEFYVVEMPLIQDDGSLAKEVHFKTGGGGSGDIDLSMYVRRPGTDLRDGRWLAYRETENGASKEWSPITTDMVETNGQLMFRDSLGRFQPTPEELDELNNQLKVNRFIWEKIQELDLKAGGVAINDQPPADPDNGMFWFDNSVDVMQLYIWHTDSDAWIPVAPPTTLEGRVAAGETTQAAIIAQIEKSLEDQAELASRISFGESEQETLKNKVNALEGVVGEHSLVFTMDNSNPREGEFNLKDGAMQVTNTLASADYITLSDTDRNGNAINLDRITEGDVLRFSSVDGQAAEIKITDGTNGFFAFTKVSGELDRLSEMPYQFILLSSFDPTGLATVDYVDAQDSALQTKVDGKIGKSGIQTLETGEWRLKQPRSNGGVSSFIVIDDNNMNLFHVATPSAPEHAANMGYVDDKTAELLPLTGGTLTGQLVMQRTDGVSWWNYIKSEKPTAWDGNDASKQQIHGLIIDIGTTNTYKQRLIIKGRNGKDLFEIHDEGEAVAEILGTLKAKDFLDENGNSIIRDAAVATERPMLWKYNPDVPANSLGNGEFNLSSSPTNGNAGEWSVYFSKRDANGQYWYPYDNGYSFTHGIDEQMMSIRGREQNCIHGKTKQWLFNQGTNHYAQLKCTYYRSSNPLASGKWYLMVIPGYFPHFTFSTDAQNNGTHS